MAELLRILILTQDSDEHSEGAIEAPAVSHLGWQKGDDVGM